MKSACCIFWACTDEKSGSTNINRTGITKVGNRHLRQLLVEAAGGLCTGVVGHKFKDLRARQNSNTIDVIAYADKVNVIMKSIL